MPKSTYVLTCLIWSLHYNVGHTQERNVSPPASEHVNSQVASLTEDEDKQDAPATLSAQANLPEGEHHSSENKPADSDPTASESPEEASSSSDGAEEATTPEAPKETIQSIIRYNAEEQKFNIKSQTIRLYKAGVIEYENIKLEADEVFLDWANHTFAVFSKKNEAGETEEKAVLTKDGIEYIAESARYNFQSHRAVAKKLFTKKDDGILRANKAKKDREDTYYADLVEYTTCNLKKPHFHISAKKVKLIQDEQVMSGPFLLHFDEVPTPLGFFFGIFFFPQKSGIIFPSYGGESDKGFCLKDGGYYIHFNDYLDLALQGDIYSKGSTGFTAHSRYKKRYQYGGDLSYQRNTHLETNELALPNKEKSWRFKWNHSTENNRTSSLAAEVDLQSASFKEKNTLPGDEGLQASVNSSVRYTNKLVGFPYSLSTSLRYAQNFQAREANATAILPSISLRTENFYPFRRKGSSGGGWYSDIHVQHTVDFENRLSNKVGNETLDFSPDNWPVLFKNSKYGVKHTVPLKTNIKIFNYFNLMPSVQYQERWYWEKINYQYNAATNKVDEEKKPGFERVWDYSGGASLNATLYGTHFFGRNAAVQAIRHQIEPVVSFTYTPDFSGPKFDYHQTLEDGKKYNRFKEGIYGAPADRATAVMGLALNNRLDMKVKNRVDVEERTKKVPILEGFDWSTSYDFLAEEFKLADIQMKARTRLFDGLFDINLNTTFDPYTYKKDEQGELKRVSELAWNQGKGIGRVSQASLSVGTKLSIGEKESTPEEIEDFESYPGAQEELKHIQEHPEQYVDFNVPLTLRLSYEWHYSSPKPGDSSSNKAFTFNGDISLTEKWKIIYASSYDITKSEFVGSATRFGIYRDLHCWEMSFDWRPLGPRQYYNFSIGVKSPLLQHLKYTRSKDYPKL